MANDRNDQINRAYARLTALKATLDADARHSQFHEKHVHEYHAILDQLAAAAETDVDEFRVPPAEVDYRVAMVDREEGTTYTDDRWVDREVLLSKLGAVLTYFKIVTAKPQQQMGFHRDR